MTGLRIVHVIEQLRLGGPLFAMAGASRHLEAGAPQDHRVISLLPADSLACRHAEQAGMTILSAPSASALEAELAHADIVHLHFWNSPVIHAWLATHWPPMRLLVWCHVNGLHAPHVLPGSLLDFADIIAMASRLSLDLPAFRSAEPGKLEFVFAGADFTRVEAVAPVAHEGINVGYVGLVDFVKLHPAFVRMCAAVDVPGVRFQICGDGNGRKELQRQAVSLGVSDRLDFVDHVEDLGPWLSRFDIFGYPLCAETSAASELALQEAMYAGIPPVVFPYGGMDALVTHKRNGLVVTSEDEYVEAVAYLCRHPEARRRLGLNAAADARHLFGAGRTACALQSLYTRMLGNPKRARPQGDSTTPDSGPATGACALIRSLDGIGDANLMTSLTASASEASSAEARISDAGPNMRNVILQYRFHYPADPYLRLWSGLVLAATGRSALAASEFKASIDLGLDHPRIRHYFSSAASPARAKVHA